MPQSKIRVIENGVQISPSDGAPRQRSADRGADRDSWTFGFFGQITPFKGVDLLLKAADILAEMPGLAKRIRIRVHGNMVGPSDSFRDEFSQAVQKYSFLSYMGPYSNDMATTLMEECDYILIPSTWWENSPVVIREAFLARRPIICTGIGGMAEKVTDGVTGLHFRVGNAADLIRALEAGADPTTHAALQGNIPAVKDHIAMAEEYLRAFQEFGAAAEPAPAGKRRGQRDRRAGEFPAIDRDA